MHRDMPSADVKTVLTRGLCLLLALVLFGCSSNDSGPEAVDDSATTNEETPIVIAVLNNDINPDDTTLRIASVTQGSNGATTIMNENEVQYVPAANFNGTDTFTYTLADEGADPATATVTVTVIQINDPPAPTVPTLIIAQNTPGTVQIAPNDPDAGQTHAYALASRAENGEDAVDAATGLVTYTPEPDFFGRDSFTVSVTDNGSPALTRTVTVQVEVMIPQVAQMQNRVFAFPDGAFGLPFAVTMTTGTFGFSTAPFRLDIGDFFAVGRLAVTAPPTCTVTFTTTDFTPFAGLIDVPLAATCTIETDNSLTIVANGVPATSQPAIAVTQNLTGVIYVQSNIPTFNGNSVLVFRRDAEGNLAPPASFLSGGAGITADPVTTAPNDAFDSDLNIILNPSNTMLFTVNGGSDTIVVFYILPDDGALVPVAGSPFPSGGVNPVSVGLAGDKLYVVNKNRDLFRQDPTRSLPNYTGFRLGVDGALTPIANSTVASLQNASPTQALISTDNTLLFGSDFGVLRLQSFRIADNGVLEQNPPLALANLVLGLQVHPTERLLYAGLSLENLLAVFPYDANGILDATNVTIVANGGVEPCWLEVNQAGTRLYTANFRDNTVSTYDLSDPANPVEIQLLELDARGRGCPFQIGLESSEAFLYLVSQRGCFPDEIPLGEGNLLRVFRVNADGTLAEVDSSPNNLNNLGVPVDPFSRPQGIAAP